MIERLFNQSKNGLETKLFGQETKHTLRRYINNGQPGQIVKRYIW